MGDAPMTPTTLAETILRDVPRHDAYDVMMTLDGHPLPGGCAFGKWVRHADVLAALSTALDPAIAERAGEVVKRLTDEHVAASRTEAADLITALLAQNAALRAERDSAIRGRDSWRDDYKALSAAIVRDTGLSAMTVVTQARLFRPRAEAAEAEVSALTARVERLTGALGQLRKNATGQWVPSFVVAAIIDAALSATTEEGHE